MSEEKGKPSFQVQEIEELNDDALDDVSGGGDCGGCEHTCSASCGSGPVLQSNL